MPSIYKVSKCQYSIFFRYVPINPVTGRSYPGGSGRPRQDHLFLAWSTFLPQSLLYFCSAVVHNLSSLIFLRTCLLHPVHRNAAVPQVILYWILETYGIGRPRGRDPEAVSLKRATLGSLLSGSRHSCQNRLSRMVVIMRIVCMTYSLRLTTRMHL